MTDLQSAESTDEAPQYVLTVTPEALDRILEIRDGEPDPGSVCLRVEVVGMQGADYQYSLGFTPIAEVDEADDISVQGGLSVVVAAESVEAMVGATLDLPSAPGQGGLVIRNPNKPDPLKGLKLELTGELADDVRILLAEVVNPQLADHGGFAELRGVEDTTVYLTMGGGCQGCAVSAQTLQYSIRETIMTALPQVTDVVDVTDHEAGSTPYY